MLRRLSKFHHSFSPESTTSSPFSATRVLPTTLVFIDTVQRHVSLNLALHPVIFFQFDLFLGSFRFLIWFVGSRSSRLFSFILLLLTDFLQLSHPSPKVHSSTAGKPVVCFTYILYSLINVRYLILKVCSVLLHGISLWLYFGFCLCLYACEILFLLYSLSGVLHIVHLCRVKKWKMSEKHWKVTH